MGGAVAADACAGRMAGMLNTARTCRRQHRCAAQRCAAPQPRRLPLLPALPCCPHATSPPHPPPPSGLLLRRLCHLHPPLCLLGLHLRPGLLLPHTLPGVRRADAQRGCSHRHRGGWVWPVVVVVCGVGGGGGSVTRRAKDRRGWGSLRPRSTPPCLAPSSTLAPVVSQPCRHTHTLTHTHTHTHSPPPPCAGHAAAVLCQHLRLHPEQGADPGGLERRVLVHPPHLHPHRPGRQRVHIARLGGAGGAGGAHHRLAGAGIARLPPELRLRVSAWGGGGWGVGVGGWVGGGVDAGVCVRVCVLCVCVCSGGG